MIFKNHKEIQSSVISFTIKTWLFLLAYRFDPGPRTCLALLDFNESSNELIENKVIKTSDGCTFNVNDNCEKHSLDSDPVRVGNSHACRFFKLSKRLMCNGSIDYPFLQRIRDEYITDFIVENYEAESLYKKKYWTGKSLETGEWYMKLPKLYQKLTGEIQLKDAGLQINVHIRMIPERNSKDFWVEGEAFSNKVIRISWKLKGSLSLDFIKEKTVISLDVGAVGDGDWRLQSNLTFLRRDVDSEADGWRVVGIIKSDYVSENQFVLYKGIVWTRMVKEEWKFFGSVNLQTINLEATLSGNLSPPQKKQITIPKSAFSNMTIKNIIFKDSNFYNDFDKNSFEGVRGLKRISFIASKLEVIPRLDELFQSFSDLEEIQIDDCVVPRLKFGALSPLTKVQKLSFKGSGPLNFDSTSFLWLRNSNLTFLTMRNSHVKISTTANSVLWSVSNTLKHLDISHSSLNAEKDLVQILKDLNILSLRAEGIKLRKIPTVALGSARKTLKYMSLKENDFRKVFEKHLFDSILNFPLMPNLVELNLEECHINFIEKGSFDNLPNLKILHLSYNNLENLQDGWMDVKPQVTFLGLSHNGFTSQVSSMALYDTATSMNLSKFKKLEILDLSDGIFTSINKLISSLGSSLRNLTLQNTRVEDLPENIFENLIGLEALDLSYNRNLKAVQPFSFSLFRNLKKLKSLNLKHCRISSASVQSPELFENSSDDFKLENLQFLDLSANNFKILDSKIFRAFPNLTILNLSGNGISDWSSMMSFNKHLTTVFLDENKIETITNDMLSDIKKWKHVKLGNNPFVCGSYVYDIIKITESVTKDQKPFKIGQVNSLKEDDFNNLEESDFIPKLFYKTKKNLEIKDNINAKILDWSDKNYICFSWSQAKFISFTQVNENFENPSLYNKEAALLWLIAVIIVGIVITATIICWKFLDIHLITRAVRNAVALSFIGRSEKGPANFKYNVFVSYSEKDRTWVVENLLPRLESSGEVKVCLHERDFQVGLSIIENILDSIDSSKNIILVVSQAFLRSQWCQYEMQLAHFRLLEKGRDQLILVFLENIPFVKRPKALRYLMMTKTYLEWPLNPKSSKDIDNFWNRLMKSILNLN